MTNGIEGPAKVGSHKIQSGIILPCCVHWNRKFQGTHKMSWYVHYVVRHFDNFRKQFNNNLLKTNYYRTLVLYQAWLRLIISSPYLKRYTLSTFNHQAAVWILSHLRLYIPSTLFHATTLWNNLRSDFL